MVAIMMVLVASLAALCAVITAVLRRHPAMTWLGTALVIGIGESYALKDGYISGLDTVLVCLTVPASYFCVGQSVRAAYGAPRSPPWFFALVGASIATSLAMLALGLPAIAQALPCQLGGLVAMADAIRCVNARRVARDRIDRSMLATLGCVTAVYAIRIPFFPLLIDRPTPFADFARADFQAGLIAVFAVLVPACVFLIVARVVANALEAQRSRADLDHLTGLPNRRRFEEIAAHPRETGGALILCDIDKFKSVNDRFGHAAGDAVIRAFAQLLSSDGLAARVGGEEFAIWLPDCPLAEATRHAEMLRREFASLRVVEVIEDHALTASFGVAPFDPNTPLDLVLARADSALYAAKRGGRDRATILDGADEPPAPTRARLAEECIAA